MPSSLEIAQAAVLQPIERIAGRSRAGAGRGGACGLSTSPRASNVGIDEDGRTDGSPLLASSTRG
jgi:hypothetical protein